ncbi:hypothetical protein M8623_003343 [Salmonella enterica subsp. enterica]|nr:hypothetical protein [Salmonella enterica subsp. enterica]
MVAKFDDRTKRLDLPLPNADNFLQDDVARLIETINDLDGQVATLDAAGKLEQAQIPDVVPQLDASKKLADSVMPVRAVMLDATGKIPVDQLPNEGTTSTMGASSEQQMLALNATVGDICDRLDTGVYYILVDLPASTLGNWRMLPRTAVTSINGETGAVTGYAKLKPIANAVAMAIDGVNGPLRLMADATDPYDAVTLKQLQTIQAVAQGGASMTGVMNNFIGAVEWFNGDRINIPPGYVAADGDEYQRNDPKVADLWTAVNAGILNSVTQAEWDAKTSNTRGSFYYNRGSYSLGDNAKTFRVPDLNGSASGDAGSVIANAYLGGSSKVLQANVGQMRESMAPAISGEFVLRAAGTVASPWNISVSQTGAFEGGGAAPFGNATMLAAGPNNPAMNGYSVKINASRSSKVYTGSAGEIRPNTAVGIWIIRANGAFQAANTSFSILTADKTLPTLGTTVQGGSLRSIYQADGKDFAASSMGVKVAIGEEPVFNLTLVDNNGKTYPYQIGGARFAGGPIPLTGIHMTRKESQDKGFLFWNQIIVDSPTANGTELMVSIYPDRICITGIIRVTGNRIDALNWPVYSVTQMLPGKTIIRKPFCPASGLGVVYPLSNVPGATTGMSAGGGYTRPIKALNEWAVFDGIGGQTTTIAINDIIYFD